MNKILDYKNMKTYVKSKGDRIQKSGIYFNIFFDSTIINTNEIKELKETLDGRVENYIKDFNNQLILVDYIFDFMKPIEERKVSQAQFKLRSKFIKVI